MKYDIIFVEIRKEVNFMKKYELTDETKNNGRILYRIKALIDFGDVKTGDLGGWIEKEGNLSQVGQCWVYNNARVYDNAEISGNAKVYDNACVFGNACVSDNVCVAGNAYVCDDSWVFGHAHISGNAKVYDNAWVYDNACVSDKVCIFGNTCVSGNVCVSDSACVYDNAHVYDNARIYDDAHVAGNAIICDNARVCENMQVSYSYAKTDLRKDIAASLRCQCNLLLTNNKVIAYKIVNKNLSSLYDKNFIYEVGKIAEVKDVEESNKSCASGLHFSNLTYWDSKLKEYTNKTYLVAEINVEDIITIQRGKIRCRKARILEKVDIE